MHHVLHPRRHSWLSLAFLALASGCPASPPEVSPRVDSGTNDRPDARVADAAGPQDASGPQGDGGNSDAGPGIDSGGPMGNVLEYGWPPDNEFTEIIPYPPDLVILQPLTVVYPGEVAYLGMIVKDREGTAAKIGVYRDVGGEPTTLVATTDVFTTQQGLNEHAPLDDVTLPAGAYWSAVILDGTTDLATSATNTSILRTAEELFPAALPASLASTVEIEAPDFNVYVGIRAP